MTTRYPIPDVEYWKLASASFPETGLEHLFRNHSAYELLPVNHFKSAYEPFPVAGMEHLVRTKRQRRVYNELPSLFDLCMRQAVFTLPQVAHELQSLPEDLSLPLVRGFLCRNPRPSVEELKDFCEAVSWVPQNLNLCGTTQVIGKRFLHTLVLPNLVRLDLRGCVWLGRLDFLKALKCLECLNLRGCLGLKAMDLLHIREVPQLQCLDVEDIPTITDDLASTISGLTCLRALNVSGTSVSDRFVEALTYGSRLRAWASQQDESRVKDFTLASESGQHEVQTLLSQYPVSSLTYFRLQGTQITDATLAHLQAIPNLLLLDVRQATKVTGRSLSSLKAKHRLIALPNNARLAARTNTMLSGVLRGECGCRSMTCQDEVIDEFTKLCQQVLFQLLQKPGSEWRRVDVNAVFQQAVQAIKRERGW
ncbi:hypothetical protein KC19_9G123300 [Ceratodon purpureus]|uniref:Uncharacterized protein n=1 Tax=Ceratodon purpureus TaxID=3225 RepID=A0A8T0GWR5_CERPU|nr:hypothetical protein KC19_9G123300 [Ceratodon purpureus]